MKITRSAAVSMMKMGILENIALNVKKCNGTYNIWLVRKGFRHFVLQITAFFWPSIIMLFDMTSYGTYGDIILPTWILTAILAMQLQIVIPNCKRKFTEYELNKYKFEDGF